MYRIRSTVLLIASMVLLRGQWEPDYRLTYTSESSYLSHNTGRCIASSGDTVHVVWFEWHTGGERIFYKRSPDGGNSWSNDTCLVNANTRSIDPCLVASGPYLHVVWADQRLGSFMTFYKRSSDAGFSWTADTCLISSAPSSYPAIAVNGSMVHVVTNSGIYKRSTDGGVTWSNDTVLSGISFPSISASDLYVHIIHNGLYHNRSSDNGQTWSGNVSIVNGSSPSVTSIHSNVHVIFTRNTYAYYIGSTDNGASWKPEIQLSVNTAGVGEPYIWAVNDHLHAVWMANNEICYTRSFDNGASWFPDTFLTTDPAVSTWPFVTVSGDKVHVIWMDNRDGNGEIYYKRNSTGNIGVQEEAGSIRNLPGFLVSTFFRDRLYITVPGGTAWSGMHRLDCYNSAGIKLFSLRIDMSSSHIYKSSMLAGLSPGIYFFALTPVSAPGKYTKIFKAIKIDKFE